MGIVAHPQGALAHGVFFPVGLKSSLAIGLRGECSKMGTHLWTEGKDRRLRLSHLRPSWSPPTPSLNPRAIMEAAVKGEQDSASPRSGPEGDRAKAAATVAASSSL